MDDVRENFEPNVEYSSTVKDLWDWAISDV